MGLSDLDSFEELAKSESAAKRYIWNLCLKTQSRTCPRCQCHKLWKLANGKQRCSQCRYSFHDLSGRWINTCRLPLNEWLRIARCFELEFSAHKIAEQMNLAYNTAHKAVMTIRHAILAHAADADLLLNGGIELNKAYFNHKCQGKTNNKVSYKIPVFGIFERNGFVRAELVPDVKATMLLDGSMKKFQYGNLVYTGQYQKYNTLVFCKHRNMKVNVPNSVANGDILFNDFKGFGNWSKQRLVKHNGISPHWFPLYLKELEFRYNHRNEDIFPLIVKFLCDQVPNLE